jgi:hypothetical protein
MAQQTIHITNLEARRRGREGGHSKPFEGIPPNDLKTFSKIQPLKDSTNSQ